MIAKSRAIVLHHIKYSETSIIVKLYTEAYGKQAYMINGIRSTKSKQKMAILQPLFLLDIEAYHKDNREIQRLKEFRLSEIYNSIPYDIGKSSTAMFLAELLSHVLRSEESDPDLFDFMHHAILYFESMKQGAANFHLWFLVKLLAYVGYKIENNHSSLNKWFNMKSGRFTDFQPSYPQSPDVENSAFISSLIQNEVDSLHKLSLSGQQRSNLLEILVEYYSLHFDGIGSLKSLKVLKEVFS